MPSGDKIINGMEAADNQFPWVVYLRCNNPGWACTASMISDTWVLTAAHCVDGCYEWTVQASCEYYHLSFNFDQISDSHSNNL